MEGEGRELWSKTVKQFTGLLAVLAGITVKETGLAVQRVIEEQFLKQQETLACHVLTFGVDEIGIRKQNSYFSFLIIKGKELLMRI